MRSLVVCCTLALAVAALVAWAAASNGQDGPPAGEALQGAPPAPRAERLAAQLGRERAGWRAERRRLRRSLETARRDLAPIPLTRGVYPLFRWARMPHAWAPDRRLAEQLVRERVERRIQRSWLGAGIRAGARLLEHVRYPTPAGNRRLARRFFGSEYGCAAVIVTGETGGTWRHDVAYGFRYGEGLIDSGLAYGLGQARPGTKMLAYGADAASNPLTQLRWFEGYARERYGSVCGAAAHWTPAGSW